MRISKLLFRIRGREFGGRLIGVLLPLALLSGCKDEAPGEAPVVDSRRLVVCTTTMIADLAREIAGDRVRVVGIMGPGQDPHVYDPTPEDSILFRKADLVLVNGLHLEGRMMDMIGAAGNRAIELAHHREIRVRGKNVVAPDPHVWWNVRHFMRFAEKVRDALKVIDPANGAFYDGQATAYLARLESLDDWVQRSVATIPESARYMITTHDAFYYYGEAYGLEVDAVLGISTDAEANAGEQSRLAKIAAERSVPAVFHETSVSAAQNRLVDGIRRLAQEKHGVELRIAGPLYSDSLGEPGGEAGSYIDAVRAKTRMIVGALGGKVAEETKETAPAS